MVPEQIKLPDIISQNKKTFKKGNYKSPKNSLASLRAWRVQQNSTFPKEETYNIAVGGVGLQLAHRFYKEPEILLFFPTSLSRGEIRSFYVKDLKEVKLLVK